MKRSNTGIAAGLILLAGAGGYAGVGHYLHPTFSPKTAINGLNCAGLTAEQVKEEIQKHYCGLYTQHYRARWKNRDIKRHGRSASRMWTTTRWKNCWSPRILLHGPAFYWKEKENQVAADSVYDKEMVQENCRRWKGFRKNSKEAPTDAYLTDDGTSYVINAGNRRRAGGL